MISGDSINFNDKLILDHNRNTYKLSVAFVLAVEIFVSLIYYTYSNTDMMFGPIYA